MSRYDHPVAPFFAFARERQKIYLAKSANRPASWTKDPILQTYYFTNVFREQDRVTEWFRKYVRDPLRDRPEVLLATVVFRMFNRVTTGEAIFCQPDLVGRSTAFEWFSDKGDIKHLKKFIQSFCGKSGPYVTGAYIVSSPPGLSKLDGVLRILKDFYDGSDWYNYALGMRREECSLEAAWEWFKDQSYLGKFHSYEIVTDLRHTALLENAEDIMTWANPGPGARRGLNRVRERPVDDHTQSRERLIREMQKILNMSRQPRYWPAAWPTWEMRDVEHTLCEFDKYERARTGEGGRMKRLYRHGV